MNKTERHLEGYRRLIAIARDLASMGDRDWTLSVRDTGLGIPEKSLPHLFKKFYRVGATEGKISGTGLRLSICK